MSRINTNVSSMLAQRILGQQNKALQTSLERLSTGLQINRGKDDPAGLIASENLRAEKAAITAAIGNAERADQVVNIAEGGLVEISNLLTELESLVDQSSNKTGLSAEEKEANQLQIDSILQTIDRIANSTSFQGSKLLNGTYAYSTSAVTSAELADVNVNAAKIANTDGSYVGVTVNTVTSAQTGQVFLSAGTGNVLSGTSLTIEVAGSKGVQQFSFASGTTGADMAAAVNAFKDVTGVSAAASASYVSFNATDFGSAHFASVTKVSGDAAYDGAINDTAATGGSTSAKDLGRDATVVVNGQTATVNGLKASVSSGSLDVDVTLATGNNTDGASSTFYVTGGGAEFSLSPKLDLAGRVSMGISSMTTGNLGSNTNGVLSELASGGTANVQDGDVDKGQRIIRDAIKEVNGTRGRLGAFQKNTVAATVRSLGVALENTSAAESQIRDTDFAAETANLTRAQIMQQAATNSLALANTQPQSVLALLG
jgi:flagellin